MPLASKPISAYRPPERVPLPPRWERSIKKPALWEFVALSMALHALAIALFGAPAGGSREGRALWGSLQVVLTGAPVDEGTALKMDRSVHIGGLSAKAKPATPPAPAEKAKARVEPVAPPVETPRLEVPKTDTPFSMPPLLDRLPRPELKMEPLSPFKVPPPTKEQNIRPPPPVPAPPAPSPPAPEVAAPVEAPAPARVERVPAPEVPVIPAPLLQPLPTAPVPERMVSPPVIERPPVVETPVVPAIPTPPVERAPVEVPAIPAPTLESVAPARTEPAVKPAEKPTVQEAPAAAPPVPPAIQRAEPPPALQRAEPPRQAPATIERQPLPVETPAARPTPFRAPPGDTVKPRTEEPSTNYDPTAAPRIDLDAARKRAAALAREGNGNRSLLPFPLPPPPERKTKEQIAIENARKPDCRTAYQQLGLAAIVPLIANEFGEGNCRW